MSDYKFWQAIVAGVVLAAVVLIGMAASGGLPRAGRGGMMISALVLGVIAGIGTFGIQYVVSA